MPRTDTFREEKKALEGIAKMALFSVNVEIDLMPKPSIAVKSWSIIWDKVAEPKQGSCWCLPVQLGD